MTASYCPYCHGARSMMLGDIYCSLQHHRSMNEMATGTLLVKSKVLEETAEHVSRLSVRCMLKGEQHYKVGGNDFLVSSNNYILVNEGQHYKTSFSAGDEQELFLVAFQPGFAEDLWHSLVTPADILLDEPFKSGGQKIYFFEKTYEQDHAIRSLLVHLRKLIDLDISVKRTIDFDSIYTMLFTRLLEVQRSLHGEINKLREVKRSTRMELFRRLSIARDFIDAHLGNNINLEDMAKTACLSVHHFKREFKVLYGYSPHRYLLMKRMDKAKQLLQDTNLMVEDVSLACGFQDTSSFIRQFKAFAGCTPGRYWSEGMIT